MIFDLVGRVFSRFREPSTFAGLGIVWMGLSQVIQDVAPVLAAGSGWGAIATTVIGSLAMVLKEKGRR